MDVFLIPAGGTRYEPYCELPDPAPDDVAPASGRGVIRGAIARFRAMLAAAEQERLRPAEAVVEPEGWGQRLRRRGLAYIADKIAEQRLLWHLRCQPDATLVYPADMPQDEASGILQASLQADVDRHVRWLAVDTLLFVASGLLMLVPGPNLVAYYFAFRMVGHYLSWRGARQGLRITRWTATPSPALAELRRVPALDPPARERRLLDIATELRLQHLATFFERIALPSA